MPSLEQFIAQLPKAELHVHLEGCVEPEMLWQLARRHRTPLVEKGETAVRQLYSTTDFQGFLQAFKTVCEHLRTPEDYELITYDALRRLASQNVRYAEVTISAGVMLWKGEDVPSSFEGIAAGYERVRKESGIRVQWIFDAVRQFGPEAALQVAHTAAALKQRGVIGFGIGGDEQKAPAEIFREVFACARREGLHLTAHAGETAGPESVWTALDVLGVERIGHGLTAARDASLVKVLAEKQLPLDICLTSNLRTGVLRQMASHPLRQYLEQGVLLSLNTDDPALFGTDLNREYLLAQKTFGLTMKEMTRLAESSFRAAFLPPDENQIYLSEFGTTALYPRSD
ncbi:MAG: adenosine deaminase [Acidobacteria bacterium]|nr:adenosine deaminase [Acidobacteriota bacterium]